MIANQTTDFVGQLAYSTGVPLNELSLKSASLEDAFMELTGDAVQYHGSTGAPPPAVLLPVPMLPLRSLDPPSRRFNSPC